MDLNSEVRYLKGVGPKLAEKLNKIGVFRIIDLLFHLPRDYQDRTTLTPLNRLTVGNYAQIEGQIENTQVTFGKRRALVVTLSDGAGQIACRLFHFNGSQKASFEKGRIMRCFAEVRLLSQGLEMIHPEYSLDPEPLKTASQTLTAIYSTTQGLSQTLWRQLQDQALELLAKDKQKVETINIEGNAKALNAPLGEALQHLHHPPPSLKVETLKEGQHPYQRRLAFEELLAHQLSLLTYRYQRQSQASPMLTGFTLASQLACNLPFDLTHAQETVLADIQNDLAKPNPMLRLVQGDVGSGKTIVAAMACCNAIEAGYQAVLMAPTEILAEQHAISFAEWFKPLGLRLDTLLGKHTAKQKREKLERLAEGVTDLVIGTHAVIEDSVIFHKLGLVIIDEQHRFGVHQRLALRQKTKDNNAPHQLIMTATPIPRTLAMTAYADLDLSVIDELPPGRQPIQTLLIDRARRDHVLARLLSACQQGQQVYWVCTLIETSEALNCQAAEETHKWLQAELPELSIGLVHGKVKPKEKSAIMETFAQGDMNILVATTVIEVGVNVPNASIMVIENPERLGLSQLHQLRGRVGRGNLQSYCLLMYQTPLSQQAKARLNIMRETTDGFKIAEKDLELRGPGDMLGENQTGLTQFRLADLLKHQDMLNDVQMVAKTLIKDKQKSQLLIDRWLVNPDYYMDG